MSKIHNIMYDNKYANCSYIHVQIFRVQRGLAFIVCENMRVYNYRFLYTHPHSISTSLYTHNACH